MKLVIGVADMKISNSPQDVLVTHALGSCLGITLYDPVVKIGGMLHVMLPTADVNPDKAKVNPYMFVDTGVPSFFKEIYSAGGVKGRLEVTVVGGANITDIAEDRFAIGKRNHVILRKLLWKNGILVKAEDVGGTVPRTMYLEIATGRVLINAAGIERELTQGSTACL